MVKAGEKPSYAIVAKRLSAKFAKVSKSVVGRWGKENWHVTPEQIEAPTQTEKTDTAMGTALVQVTGNPTQTLKDFKETPEAQEVLDELDTMSYEDLVKRASREQFKTLILMQIYVRKLASEGIERQIENAEGVRAPVKEAVEPQIMGSLVAALSGSFSTSTSVAAQARDLAKTGATPGAPVDAEFREVPSTASEELKEVMDKVRAAAASDGSAPA